MEPWLEKALTNILAVILVAAMCFGIISLCVSCGKKAFAIELSTEQPCYVQNCDEVKEWQTFKI